jgi:hypothetical protein
MPALVTAFKGFLPAIHHLDLHVHHCLFLRIKRRGKPLNPLTNSHLLSESPPHFYSPDVQDQRNPRSHKPISHSPSPPSSHDLHPILRQQRPRQIAPSTAPSRCDIPVIFLSWRGGSHRGSQGPCMAHLFLGRCEVACRGCWMRAAVRPSRCRRYSSK